MRGADEDSADGMARLCTRAFMMVMVQARAFSEAVLPRQASMSDTCAWSEPDRGWVQGTCSHTSTTACRAVDAWSGADTRQR